MMLSHSPETLASLTRALRLLRILERSPSGLALMEASQETGLPKATALRMLRSLAESGLIVRDADSGRYVSHPTFWVRMVAFVGPAVTFLQEVTAVLERLAAQERATAMIIMPDERRRLGIVPVCVFSPVGVVMDPRARGSLPLHGPAAGKCFLAHLPKEQLQEYTRGGLMRVTRKTITSVPRLRRELATVRRRGFALNLGELEARLPGVGVPLRHEDGEVIGGVSLGYAEPSYGVDYLTARVPTLRAASEEIGALLSYASYRRYMQAMDLTAPPPPPEDEVDAGGGSVRSVGRAVRLLTVLGQSQEGETAATLARRRKLERTAAVRLLRTMAAEGFVRRDEESGRYHLDPAGWLRQAPILRTTTSLEATLRFVLQRLAQSAGATAFLSCRDMAGMKAVRTAVALPAQKHAFFRPDPVDRQPLPLEATAAGRCLLAWEEEAAQKVPGEEADLGRQLRLTRKRGAAIGRGERVEGVGEIAAPVRDKGGGVMAAVGVLPLAYQMTEWAVAGWEAQVKATAEILSRVLTSDWRQRVEERSPGS